MRYTEARHLKTIIHDITYLYNILYLYAHGRLTRATTLMSYMLKKTLFINQKQNADHSPDNETLPKATPTLH